MASPPAPALLDRRLLVVLGKGGVGKSTLTAALALAALRQGKRVLACEVNADDRLPDLFGAAPAGTKVTEIRPGLSIVNVHPHEAMIEYGHMKLKSAALVHAVLENRVMRYFLGALPSLAEVVTMGKILFHVREQEGARPRFDLVIVDSPATGHGLGLLTVSRSLIGTVPGGPLREDLLWMAALLEDPAQTAINLVTLPEELPVNETLELDQALRKAGLPRGACFVNGVWPTRFAPGELELLPDGEPWREAKATAARMQGRADHGAASLRRLRDALDLPVIELPQLFVERFDEAVLDRFSRLLDGQLAEPAHGDDRRVGGVS